ncbi:MAG: SDR family oxidoreductase [Xanthomonadales bacterium]|nr:SDR family oxidoreductase [Xanthomonadales bacterium]
MRIFVAGASGFIGSALVEALRAGGHELRLGGRDPAALRAAWPECEAVAVDYSRDHDPAAWRERVRGCGAVVNLVGIFAEGAGIRFEDVHVRAPVALFEGCRQAGVSRVVQVSALGAGRPGAPAFLASKERADAALLAQPLDGRVLRPSLVFGAQGTSTRLFLQLALLPLLPLPGGGRQRVQPVDLSDLVDAIVHSLAGVPAEPVLAVVGPRALRLREYLEALRRGLGGGRLRVMPVPEVLLAMLARLSGRLAPFARREALELLERGNCADAGPLAELLGRQPRAADAFIRPAQRAMLRRQAALASWLPLLRLSVALVWLWTAAVSLGLYPRADSLDLLARAGVAEEWRPAALYLGAGLDLAFGLLTLFAPRRWRLYGAQALLVLAYMAILSWRLPEFWLHPFGPLLKNLPLLAALGLLAHAEPP